MRFALFVCVHFVVFIISEEVDRRFLASGHTQSIGRCLVMSKSNNVQVLRMSKLYQCDGLVSVSLFVYYSLVYSAFLINM